MEITNNLEESSWTPWGAAYAAGLELFQARAKKTKFPLNYLLLAIGRAAAAANAFFAAIGIGVLALLAATNLLPWTKAKRKRRLTNYQHLRRMVAARRLGNQEAR